MVNHFYEYDYVYRTVADNSQTQYLLAAAAWDDGYRKVVLETHANWHNAVALYQRLGYQLQSLP